MITETLQIKTTYQLLIKPKTMNIDILPAALKFDNKLAKEIERNLPKGIESFVILTVRRYPLDEPGLKRLEFEVLCDGNTDFVFTDILSSESETFDGVLKPKDVKKLRAYLIQAVREKYLYV